MSWKKNRKTNNLVNNLNALHFVGNEHHSKNLSCLFVSVLVKVNLPPFLCTKSNNNNNRQLVIVAMPDNSEVDEKLFDHRFHCCWCACEYLVFIHYYVLFNTFCAFEIEKQACFIHIADRTKKNETIVRTHVENNRQHRTA